MTPNANQAYPSMVKVLTTHQVVQGGMDAVLAIIETMHQAVAGQPGYILDEVFVPQWQNKEVMVITSWQTIEDWNHWFDHPVRAALQRAMDNHLEGATAYTIYRDQ